MFRLLVAGFVALFSACGSVPVRPVLDDAQSVTVKIQHWKVTELGAILREVLEHPVQPPHWGQKAPEPPPYITVGIDVDSNSITLCGLPQHIQEALDFVARLDVAATEPESRAQR